MRVTCPCGEVFEAKRESAKFCSAKCRMRAHRAPAAKVEGEADGKLLRLAPPAPPAAELDVPWSFSVGLAATTLRELTKANRADTVLGAAALLLANRLDNVGGLETGSGLAALNKEYRATVAEALKDAEEADDALDQIRASAALKLIQGGRSA